MLSSFGVLFPDVKVTEGFLMHILFLIKTLYWTGQCIRKK